MKFKKVLATLLTLCMVLGLLPAAAFAAETPATVAPISATDTAKTFPDTAGHWAESAIVRWAGYGIVKGDEAGKFNPDADISRAALATILADFLKLSAKSANAYTDVPADAWFADAVLKCTAAGIMKGSDGLAKPGDCVTRQEAMAMIARALGVAPATADLTTFTDGATVADWAAGYVTAMTKRGIVAGVGGNTVAPLVHMNRASVLSILDKAVSDYIAVAGTYSKVVGTGIVAVVAPDVVLKGNKIAGSLLVAEGVGDGNFTLDGTNVAGTTTVRGGGVNSFVVKGGSKLGAVTISRVDGAVRVVTSDGSTIETTFIDDGKDDVIMEGKFGDVVVDGNVPVTLKGADVKNVTATGKNADITVDKTSKVDTVATKGEGTKITVAGTVNNVAASAEAKGVSLTVAKGGNAKSVVTAAAGSVINNDGKVGDVSMAKGADTKYVAGEGTALPKFTATDKKDLTATTAAAEKAAAEKAAAEKLAAEAKTDAEKKAAEEAKAAADKAAAAAKKDEDKIKTDADKGTVEKPVTPPVVADPVKPEEKPVDPKPTASAKPSQKPNPGGGGDEPAPTYLYNVVINVVGNGTVTADVMHTNEKNKTVTLSLAAAAGWKLNTITAKDEKAADVAITGAVTDATNTFLLAEHRTVTVTATFIKPLNSLELFVVHNRATYARLTAIDPTNFAENPSLTDADLGAHPWLVIYAKRDAAMGATKIQLSDVTYTRNNVEMNKSKITATEFGKLMTAYIGSNEADADRFESAVLSGHYEVSIVYGGVTYTASTNFKANGETPVTVTFKNGETVVSTYQAIGTETPVAPVVTKTGYTVEWYTATTGGTKLGSQNINALKGDGTDLTLFARWTANSYTITYDGNGKTSGDVPANDATPKYDADVTLAAKGNLVKTDCAFTGWNTQADGNGTHYAAGDTVRNLVATGSVTLYAEWKSIADIKAAPLVDQRQNIPEAPAGSYVEAGKIIKDYTATGVVASDSDSKKIVNVNFTGTHLMKHAAGNGALGFWVGIAVPKVEGETYTYARGAYPENAPTFNKLADGTYAEGGVEYNSFYFNIENHEPAYLAVKSAGAPGKITVYNLDFSHVTMAAPIENAKLYLVTDKASFNLLPQKFKTANPWDDTRSEADVIADSDLPWLVVSYDRNVTGIITFAATHNGNAVSSMTPKTRNKTTIETESCSSWAITKFTNLGGATSSDYLYASGKQDGNFSFSIAADRGTPVQTNTVTIFAAESTVTTRDAFVEAFAIPTVTTINIASDLIVGVTDVDATIPTPFPARAGNPPITINVKAGGKFYFGSTTAMPANTTLTVENGGELYRRNSNSATKAPQKYVANECNKIALGSTGTAVFAKSAESVLTVTYSGDTKYGSFSFDQPANYVLSSTGLTNAATITMCTGTGAGSLKVFDKLWAGAAGAMIATTETTKIAFKSDFKSATAPISILHVDAGTATLNEALTVSESIEVKAGATLDLVNTATLKGTADTSTLVIVGTAKIKLNGDSDTNTLAAGTYKWSTATSAWVKQP